MLYIKENQRRQRSVFGRAAQWHGWHGWHVRLAERMGVEEAHMLGLQALCHQFWCWFQSFMMFHDLHDWACFMIGWRSSATSGTRSSKILKPRLGVDVECAGNVLWANPSFYTCFWDTLRQISCSLSWQHDTSRSTRSPHSFLWGCCEGLLGRNVKQKCHGSYMEAEWLKNVNV